MRFMFVEAVAGETWRDGPAAAKLKFSRRPAQEFSRAPPGLAGFTPRQR